MLFNTFEFAIFLPIVFLCYWYVTNKNLKLQNFLLLAASYVFYGWWDVRFLLLIFFSSTIDFLVGLGMSKSKTKVNRKLLLLLSISVNLGMLGFFKYFNFFIENFASTFAFFGSSISPDRLNIILPVGISFYTFQTLSYSIDVYRKKLQPTRDPIAFFAFVSFFPQLVAGPIERATNLLPQFYTKRTFSFDKAVDGLRQILWGLFKKIVIADNCAVYVNDVFENFGAHSGSTLFLAGTLFAMQIYCDFSGYSDIAIGVSRLFGFNLMKNFSFPYFSRDIAEFWRRWHISLSTWFKDYLYIPLGGSKGGTSQKIRNTFIVFLVSGFWHGANWTFLVWGFLNALYFLPLLLLGKNRVNVSGVVAEGHLIPSIREIYQISTTFFITTIAWIFFRAPSVQVALEYIYSMFSMSFFSIPDKLPLSILTTLPFVILFLLMEWYHREREFGLQFDNTNTPKFLRQIIYIGIIFIIVHFGGVSQDFIYFQF